MENWLTSLQKGNKKCWIKRHIVFGTKYLYIVVFIDIDLILICFSVKEQIVCDVERDTKVSCLPPAKLTIPSDSPVIQISCGLHHSILLLQNGQVKTYCIYCFIYCSPIVIDSFLPF